MLKIGVLGSGNGSNFQAIADAIEKGNLLGVQVAVVISDVEDAYILKRAQNIGVKGLYINPGQYKTKLDQTAESEYIKALKEHNVDLVVLAGFMRMIKKDMIDVFCNKIINIHPSLLPAFPGLCSYKQAFDYGVKVTGCTVHFVDSGMDTGPIIGQKTVRIDDSDTAHSVHEKIQVQEHILYPECIKLIADGKLQITGRKVSVCG